MRPRNEPPEKLLRASNSPKPLKKKPQAAANEHEAEVRSLRPAIVPDANERDEMKLAQENVRIKSLAKHLLGQGLKPGLEPHLSMFERDSPLESLESVFRQCKPGDSREVVDVIVAEVKRDYAADAGQTAVLRRFEDIYDIFHREGEAEKKTRVGPAFPVPTDAPADFGGPEPTFTLADAKAVIGETRYEWDGYIMRAGINAISGDPGAGKTCFAMDLHRRQYHKLTWPDGKPVEESGRKIVWLMGDMRLSQLADLAEAYSVPMESIVIASERKSVTSPLSLTDAGHLARLAGIIAKEKPWAVVIDSWTSAMGSSEQSKPEIVNPLADFLMDVAISHDVAILSLCHSNAEGGIYGKALARRAEHQLSLLLSNRHIATSERNLHVKRSRRIEETQSLGIVFGRTGWNYCEPWEEVEDAARVSAVVKAPKVVELVEQEALAMAGVAGDKGFAQADLVEALAVNDNTDAATIRKRASRAVRRLVEAGTLTERGGRYYAPKPS